MRFSGRQLGETYEAVTEPEGGEGFAEAFGSLNGNMVDVRAFFPKGTCVNYSNGDDNFNAKICQSITIF